MCKVVNRENTCCQHLLMLRHLVMLSSYHLLELLQGRSTGSIAGTYCNKRRRVTSSQANINSDEFYINLDCGGKPVVIAEPPAPPPPPPKEITFKCPVCLEQLVDATSTKCGHIFCEECLKTALATQAKCPSCRKRAIMKDAIRVYLPAIN